MLLKPADADGENESLRQLFDGQSQKDKKSQSGALGLGRSKTKDKQGSQYGESAHTPNQLKHSVPGKYGAPTFGNNLNELLSAPLEPIEELLDPRLHGLPERVDIEGDLRRYYSFTQQVYGRESSYQRSFSEVQGNNCGKGKRTTWHPCRGFYSINGRVEKRL